MKNKKGFTLVEILAVIIILALLMIIMVPSVMDSFNDAKKKIGEIEKKNLQEAASTLALEVLNCELSTSEYNYLFNKSVTNCNQMQNSLLGNTVETTVAKLKEKGLFEDYGNKCSGTLKITTNSSNYQVSVDVSSIECKK